MNESDVRAVTAKIAEGYDLVPYNPEGAASPGLDPAYVFGLAGLYGSAPANRNIDVLDLGCGTGSQLLRAAAQTTGQLAGIDISRAACAGARARLGPRCRVMQADLLDFDLQTLGTFDLIYLVGVFYVVPPEVQARLLQAITLCLKPGGAVVISYYSPEIARAIDALRRSIHAAVSANGSPQERILAGRRHVEALLHAGGGGIPERITTHALTCDEPIFFHEMLGEILTSVSAAALERELGPSGIHFLNWMMPGPFVHTPATARAVSADAVPGGGYHYAVFARSVDESAAASDWANVLWQTPLRRAKSSRFGAAVFADPVSGRGLEIASTGVTHALDALAAGPCPWADIQREVLRAGACQIDLQSLKRDFLNLWLQGGAAPIWSPQPSI